MAPALPRDVTMQDHDTLARDNLAATSWHAVHSITPHINRSTDYRMQMVPGPTTTDRGLSVSNFGQSQQRQQRQHPHGQPRHSQPQMQAQRTHQLNSKATHSAYWKQNKEAASSAVATLLPHCTADIPLNESQVISITDVAGSLKELVLLALGAKEGDGECVGKLQSALGSEQAVAGLVDFFSDEYEIG
ncbi:hypothetical protein OPT61_g1496 [Boeremia exigua]|uniref:Uncharacterized protein n=1 Tax=Boeremia exigua TaxID=749465 RepID=A0ACC2IQ52_9PLEO|nr:hypothetical protein OPT61_g1496 [Boeremia exigua]